MKALLTNLRWEVFSHLPYSPGLAPSDFHIFAGLKKSLRGKHFLTDAETCEAESTFFEKQDVK